MGNRKKADAIKAGTLAERKKKPEVKSEFFKQFHKKEEDGIDLESYKDFLKRYGLAPLSNGEYVDKEEFYKHMCTYCEKRDAKWVEFEEEFNDEVSNAQQLGKELPDIESQEWVDKWREVKPQADDFIANSIIKIATHLSYLPNFHGYTYRADMISDAIEACCRYIDNFDPKKSENPFAYFTQICWYSFLRRIALEKNQSEIRGKIMMRSLSDEFLSTEEEIDNLNIDESIRNSHAFVELAEKRDAREKERVEMRKKQKESREREENERTNLSFLFKEE